MGLRVFVPILPSVRLSVPPKKPVRPWHWGAKTPAWVAVAALVVVAGCASEGPAETPASVSVSPALAETTSSAYTTTPPLLLLPPPLPPSSSPPLPPPPPEPQAASQCDANYSGACVPIASEVDCEGGSGNGPAYVRGPVYVVGEDIYDLDADGDGVGCESSVVNAGLEDLVVPEDCKQVNRAQPPMMTQTPSPQPTTQTPTPTQRPPGGETSSGGSSE